MNVSKVMTSGVECTKPNATLHEVANRMNELNVGSMPVCENDRLVGMITDRDVTIRATAKGANPDSTHVRDVMTPNVHWCLEDQDVAEAARIMEEKQIRRLPVLNRDKRLVGIVSLGDLAVDIGNEVLAGRTLEAVSTPSRPDR